MEKFTLKRYLYNLYNKLNLNELSEELKFSISRDNKTEVIVLKTIIKNKLYIKNN